MTSDNNFMTALLKDISDSQEASQKWKEAVEERLGCKVDFETPLNPDERTLYRRAMVETLLRPLIAFADWKVTREVCKSRGIDIGVSRKADTFFLLNGKEQTILPFRFGSRLFGKDGRSLSFVEACFGSQVPEGTFTQRAFEDAPPPEHNPFFILKRLIYKRFKKVYGIQVVLTLTTYRPVEERFKEGPTFLEFGYIGTTPERRPFRTPMSPWTQYTRDDRADGFNQYRSDLDDQIDRLCKEPVDLSSFSCWDCAGDIHFRDAVERLETETAEMQAKLRPRA